MLIAFAAGICLIVAAIFAALWLQLRARLREAAIDCEAVDQQRAALAALLDTVPIRGVLWPHDGGESAIGKIRTDWAGPPYDEFLAGLDPADAARLAASVEALRQSGTEFDTAIGAPGAAAYRIEGRKTATGES